VKSSEKMLSFEAGNAVCQWRELGTGQELPAFPPLAQGWQIVQKGRASILGGFNGTPNESRRRMAGL